MAVKTITIDMEAYELLSAEKHGKESFSKVIKRTFKARKKTAGSLLENISRFALSNETLEAAEQIVSYREDEQISSRPINSEL